MDSRFRWNHGKVHIRLGRHQIAVSCRCASSDSWRSRPTIVRLASANSGVVAISGSASRENPQANAALMRPGRAVLTTTWVARKSASSMLCVIQRMVLPVLRQIARILDQARVSWR